MPKLPALTKTALAVALAGTLGLAAVPATYAQDAKPGHAQAKQPQQELQRPGQWRNHQMRGNPDRGNGRGLMDIIASPRGAEALEIAFVRLSHRIELTDAQKPAFDDLKTTALDAQKTFADAAKAARETLTPTAGSTPDMVAMLKARVAIDTARLEAMNTVMPKLETFLNGLSDTQKASLMPKRDNVGWQRGPGMMGGKNGMHGPRGQMPAQPGAMQAQPDDTQAKPTT
ncbi:hypothetical protein GCM10011321_02290 [Youhaiella tibetensis]|uniref:Uncharacterized protein n=1 Tax=Paradevosia tibetensis TaxID=1447062 RepID=A0A5B9DSZ6_9HYPH|nr:Spy/CpxP family protein refolding chaperone [Youhaiella tibetensis]AKR56515.1 hypothetical protein XM25_12060 [Devosia sp. H5989]QEE21558.1 hypothetical protein FNA67_15785 [Youhaiella tibetensis]GGF13901.1 hypothetical protein GCM10011321_02290 [Youhaiella tibetensis]